ncbi:glycosyltransferase [Belnapia sp. T18]|uniref:Glycosyltransferase n=1 Tax=Belnapia arida TaxID=2804533 RepID=A0ABS1UBN6_9PROT|nr:glycosyltransferase [Belnapia arida]MBL6081097.1 glycosyltransferase [Belnapia arida]
MPAPDALIPAVAGPRIVWATRFPPSDAFRGGDAIYTAKLVRSLGRQARVDVLCHDGGGGAERDADPGVYWHRLAWRKRPGWQSVAHRVPNIAFQFDRPAFWARLRTLSAEADAVFLDHLGVWGGAARFATDVRRAGGPPVIAVTHNHEASLRRGMTAGVGDPLLRAALRLDSWKAARLEARTLRAVDAATCITEADLAAFRADHETLPLLVLPPGYDGPVVGDRRISPASPVRAVLLGSTTAFHKRLVLEQALASLQCLNEAAELSIDVVGDIDGEFHARAAATAGPGLRVVGYVPDLAATLAGARAAILADTVGGGFKLRALSLVFHRVPILAVAGALDGMGLAAGRHFLEFPDLASLVRALPAVLRDVGRLDTMQQAAFEHARGRFDWDRRATALLDFARSLRGSLAAGSRARIARA